MELLRVDPAHEIAGLRWNAWMSLVGIVAGVTWYVLSQRRERPARPRGDGPRAAADAADGRPGLQARPTARLDSPRVASAVRDLELDLDAFEGPFDLLLTLILKDQLEPAEIDIA